MTNSQVSDLMYHFFVIAVTLSAPVLLISMIIGIIIALFQAATQIHEQTLTFVPKLAVIGAILVITGGSMLATMQDFMRYMFELMLG